MTLRFMEFEDRRRTIQRVQQLAASPFNEATWRPQIESFGWQLGQDPFHRKTVQRIILRESDDPTKRYPDGAHADPDGSVCFATPEFSMLFAYLWCESFDEPEGRRKTSDAFAVLQNEACAAIGEPDFRLHFTQDFLPLAIFGTSVWCFPENDLYLIQDVGDMHGGTMGIIGFRVLPKTKQPTALPPKSVFHT